MSGGVVHRVIDQYVLAFGSTDTRSIPNFSYAPDFSHFKSPVTQATCYQCRFMTFIYFEMYFMYFLAYIIMAAYSVYPPIFTTHGPLQQRQKNLAGRQSSDRYCGAKPSTVSCRLHVGAQ